MKKLIAVLLFSLPLFAQVQVAPFVNPKVQFFNAGVPCSGCKLNTYAAGTSSQQPTYSDSLGTTPNSNPVVMDGNGFATIYLTSQNYKFVLTTSAGGVIWSQDNVSWNNLASTLSALTVAGAGPVTINSATAATSGANQTGPQLQECGNFWNGSVSGSDCWSWQDVLGAGSNPTSTLTLTHSGSSGAASVSIPSVTVALGGNETVAGTLVVTGNVTETAGQNQYKAFFMNGVRWVDGIKYTTLAGCYADLSAGQTCKVPPGYTETLTANLVLNKKQTSIQFQGGATITLGAFNVQVAQGTDDVSIISPFAHSSDQGGNCVGVCFNGYTGSGAAIDVGSSAGFTYNTLIRGIAIDLFSAQANAIGIRRTNGVAGPEEYNEVVFGPVAGQVGFQFVGTGALFDGTSNITGPECNSSASATNNKCLQFTGVNQNGYTIQGGHANMGGSANGSVCIDAAAGTSGVDPGGFDCDVAATSVTIESVANVAVRGWIRQDSGATATATISAGAQGNRIDTNQSTTVTDNGTAGANSVVDLSKWQFNTRRWRFVSEAGGSGFQIIDQSDNSQAIAKGVGGATHIDSSAGNPVRFNQNTGSGIELWNNTAAVWAVDNSGRSTIKEAAAPSGAVGNSLFWADSTSHCLRFNNNNGGSSGCIPQMIAAGTASMTTAGIATGACGTTVTVAATGVLTTDVVDFSRNAAATIGNGGGLTLNAWPTANNVNFNYCNSSAGTITPTAMTVNFNVTR